MKQYSDYPKDMINEPDFPWVKFKIIVEREEDKKELLDAFEYLHDGDIDTNFITVNH